MKNLSLRIPRNKFVVITGVSGSGKSTLAFDLLFAEGQRRFLDSMNTYARQFVEQLSRPDVDSITGIPPTVSIEQRNSRGGGKSTVATVTEIYHFLRLLYARLGTFYCPKCQTPVGAQTRDQLGRQLQAELKKRGDLLLLAPVIVNRKGFHTDVAALAAKQGYAEIRADGKMYPTNQTVRLDRFREHNVEIVTGVLDCRPGKTKLAAHLPQRLIDETLELGNGTLYALDNARQLTVHSTQLVCPQCRQSFEPLDPKQFSFNSPRGWCPACRGFGELFYLPDVERGARADSIEESWYGWQEGQREICPDCRGARLNAVARSVRLNMGQAYRSAVISATPGRLGRANLENLNSCPTIEMITELSASHVQEVFRRLEFHGREAEIARDILPEIRERLSFLRQVGLDYMQLCRGIPTLSSGEAQRVRLAAQLGSNLSGALYIMDEPTIGLHARDTERLLAALAVLRSRGNSLIVVEHDETTMRQADHIIDLGPGAGVNGGCLVASGSLAQLSRHKSSITGRCLRQRRRYPSRGVRRPVWETSVAGNKAASSDVREGRFTCPTLALHHARRNNLKDLTVTFPLNRFVVVTGVSGSGKSTLVCECLLPAVEAKLRAKHRPSARRGPASDAACLVEGSEHIRAVYEVDQAPIGRTPRSIPATYVGFLDDIRRLFAQTPESRLRGYSASRFSFNSKPGRCPACEGAGVIKLEMNFLPPAYVGCETCGKTRFNPETLDVEYRGINIAKVLDLSVAEAIDFFGAVPAIRRPLEALRDTGLDYIKLGQTSPTLSGGEAQRLKLVTHLLSGFRPAKSQALPHAANTKDDGLASSRQALNTQAAKGSLFLLEEPTIGLHTADVRRLVDVLQRLVDAGHTVIVIEHNLDLIAEADWVIDLGPEGGDGGGQIVGTCDPEQLSKNNRSHTGRFLRKVLGK